MATYRIYMDEDGYRFSCRVKECPQPSSTHWLKRADAVIAADDHYSKLHAERDRDLEGWVEALANADPTELERLRREAWGTEEVIGDSSSSGG